MACLEELAQARTALSDVRPGPLGTLDVYVFADGTTLCMTPGHRRPRSSSPRPSVTATPRSSSAAPASPARTLPTFECAGASVCILADRVIASA